MLQISITVPLLYMVKISVNNAFLLAICNLKARNDSLINDFILCFKLHGNLYFMKVFMHFGQ